MISSVHVSPILNRDRCSTLYSAVLSIRARRRQEAHADRSVFQCCSGFCIDLLHKLSEDLGFDYELFEVEDRQWGARKGHGSTKRVLLVFVTSNDSWTLIRFPAAAEEMRDRKRPNPSCTCTCSVV